MNNSFLLHTVISISLPLNPEFLRNLFWWLVSLLCRNACFFSKKPFLAAIICPWSLRISRRIYSSFPKHNSTWFIKGFWETFDCCFLCHYNSYKKACKDEKCENINDFCIIVYLKAPTSNKTSNFRKFDTFY